MSLLLLLRSVPLAPIEPINRRVDHVEGESAATTTGGRSLDATAAGSRVGENSTGTGSRTL